MYLLNGPTRGGMEDKQEAWPEGAGLYSRAGSGGWSWAPRTGLRVLHPGAALIPSTPGPSSYLPIMYRRNPRRGMFLDLHTSILSLLQQQPILELRSPWYQPSSPNHLTNLHN